MQVRGVSFAALADIASFHTMRAVPAYARPGWTGVCLRPTGAYYRRVGRQTMLGGPERLAHAVCWHGHRRFLIELFARWPDAVVETTFQGARHRITRRGDHDGRWAVTCWSLSDWLQFTAGANVGSAVRPYTDLARCRHASAQQEA